MLARCRALFWFYLWAIPLLGLALMVLAGIVGVEK